MAGRAMFARLPGSSPTTPSKALSSPGTRVGCGEYAMTVAARVYFSSFYRLIYFFTVLASIVCVVWTGLNRWHIPSSVLFISLEIIVSALLVFEVLLRMMAFKRRFWTKWCNIFDVVALVLSLVSVAMYFNEEGVLRELEEVAADSILALRNAVQYIRLAIFLKNRTEKSHLHDSEIDFGTIAELHPDDEREAMLNAESGVGTESDDDDDDVDGRLQVVTAH